MSFTDPPADARKIPRSTFDEHARKTNGFVVGPFISSFGDGYGEPYVPLSKRKVWGTLDTGEKVWADAD